MEEKVTYSDLATEIAHCNRALGHPARITLLVEIAKKGSIINGETLEIPNLSQATVMQHLRELKRAGIIQGRIFGAKATYKIDQNKLQAYAGLFQNFMNHFIEH